jgi:hypothetical protein
VVQWPSVRPYGGERYTVWPVLSTRMPGLRFRRSGAVPRGALKRPADTRNLFKTGCSSAFLTHLAVSAGDFNHPLLPGDRGPRPSLDPADVGGWGGRAWYRYPLDDRSEHHDGTRAFEIAPGTVRSARFSAFFRR